MFCSRCGAQIDEGNSFCTNCGTKAEENVQPSPSPTPQQNAVIHEQPVKAEEIHQPEPTNAQPNKQPNEMPFIEPAAQAINVVAAQSIEPPVTQSFVVDTQTGANSVKKKRAIPIIISIAAIVVIAIIAACLYFFVFSSQPAYILSVQESYRDGKIYQITKSTYSENGTTLTRYIEEEGKIPESFAYRDIGDGVSVVDDNSGRYETNANGDVIYFETTSNEDPNKKSISEYTYYKPGIIKTVQRKNITLDKTYISTYTYDEDGWIINSVTPTYSSSNESENETRRYEYERSSDEKTIIQKCYVNNSLNTTYRCVLDDSGYITEWYRVNSDGTETMTLKNTYTKINQPTKFVAAISRLK